METFIVEKLCDDAQIPSRAHETDAGFDLYLAEDVSLNPREVTPCKTGIAIGLKPGYEAQVRPRSGFSSKEKIMIINSPGTVDADYRGEIVILAYNLNPIKKVFKKGTRIAQMVINKLPDVSIVEGTIYKDTVRGDGGFGSTGE